MSLRTSCWFLPQNEQRSRFLVSTLPTLLISVRRPDTSHHSRNPAGQTNHMRLRSQPTSSRDKVAVPQPYQLSRKLLRILDRLGCFSFLSAFASIWRMPSHAPQNSLPPPSRLSPL